MVDCEMCGRDMSRREDELVDAIIEGAVVKVCLDCSRHGSVILINQPVVDKKMEKKREIEAKPEFVDVVVEDFANRIKKGRERKGLKQEDLAQAIAEKESVVHQLETGKLKPSYKLAKKLSVFLSIDLLETVESSTKHKKDINFHDDSVTIGDLLKKG